MKEWTYLQTEVGKMLDKVLATMVLKCKIERIRKSYSMRLQCYHCKNKTHMEIELVLLALGLNTDMKNWNMFY